MAKIRDEYEFVARGVAEAEADLRQLSAAADKSDRSTVKLDRSASELAQTTRRMRSEARAAKAELELLTAKERLAAAQTRQLAAEQRGLSAALGGMKGALGAAAGAYATFAGTFALFDAAQQGAKLLDYQENLARTTLDIEALRAASSDTIPLDELLKATQFASQYASRLNLVGTSQQELLRSAVALADAFDRDLTSAYKAVLDAAAGATGGLRKQFGVVVDATDVLKEYAAQTGKAVASLTAHEKQAALSAAVQLELNKALETAPLKSSVTQFDQLTTALANLAAEIKQEVAVAIIDLVGAWRELNGEAGKFYDTISPAAQAQRNLAGLREELKATDYELKQLERSFQSLAGKTFRRAEYEAQFDALQLQRQRLQRQIGQAEAAIAAGNLPGAGRVQQPRAQPGAAQPAAAPTARAPMAQARQAEMSQSGLGVLRHEMMAAHAAPSAGPTTEAEQAQVDTDAIAQRVSGRRIEIEVTEQQTQALMRQADAAARLVGIQESYADALGQSAAAAIFEGQSVRKALAAQLEGLAKLYAARAVGSLAMGLLGNPGAFAAAGQFAAAAAIATAGAAALGGSGGGGSKGAVAQPASMAPAGSRFAAPQRSDRDDRPLVVHVNVGGPRFDAAVEDAVTRSARQPRRGVARAVVAR